MTLHRFFVNAPLAPGGEGSLEGDQARQVSRVLRLGAGAELALFDGSGLEARVVIVEARRDFVRYRITALQRPDREPSILLTVGLALLRGDRFDLAVQKLTEVGVERIVPLAADRSVVSYPDARDWAKRDARLRRVAVEAAEQAERLIVPRIAKPRPLDAFLEAEPVHALVERVASDPLGSLPLAARMSLAIGPEGGWSEREMGSIDERAAGTISLGRLVLRAETAAIVASGTVIQRWWAERWNAKA